MSRKKGLLKLKGLLVSVTHLILLVTVPGVI